MKIPEDYYVSPTSGIGLKMKMYWEDAATDLSLKHGIFIDVVMEYVDPVTSDNISEIYFKVSDHKFGSLTELTKALENKAFL